MTKRTHEEMRAELPTLGYSDACEIIEQLLAETDDNERALSSWAANIAEQAEENKRLSELCAQQRNNWKEGCASLAAQAEAWQAAAEAYAKAPSLLHGPSCIWNVTLGCDCHVARTTSKLEAARALSKETEDEQR